MMTVVPIRLRQAGQVRFFKLGGADGIGGLDLKVNDYCIVQSERGLDFGQVLDEPRPAMEDEAGQRPAGQGSGGQEQTDEPLLMVVRKITINDRFQINKNIRDAQAARDTCVEKVAEHNLPMKLVDVEYSFDRSKIIFYFTAEGRVDFRALVKDLARAFRARIELRQIGVRDESKLLGGIGCCGRIICCASWLRSFSPINIRMAKDQHLSLNPTKLSGVCGRLLCCLKYEHECYRDLGRGLPSNGAIVKTPQGQGTVIDQQVLRREVTVRLDDDRIVHSPVDEIEIIQEKARGRKNKQ
ncbi:MAG: stage 0 sporulation family protein [Verrucomicrobia bacterium]|nr:stage 0 sporulation family protein [Verrucomicrobiota bacterium]